MSQHIQKTNNIPKYLSTYWYIISTHNIYMYILSYIGQDRNSHRKSSLLNVWPLLS